MKRRVLAVAQMAALWGMLAAIEERAWPWAVAMAGLMVALDFRRAAA